MSEFIQMQTVIPAAVKGAVRVEHFEITKQDADRYNVNPWSSRGSVTPGRYVRLVVGNTMMMSDTEMEHRTNRVILRKATGHVLITGLGIGMILVPLLQKPDVLSVTVVEKYQDVVDLILPAIQKALPEESKKLQVVVRDVLEWKPKKGELRDRFDVIYHDIWPNITAGNLPEMALLKRRYAKKLATGGFQFCWEEDTCRFYKKRNAR